MAKGEVEWYKQYMQICEP